jgi:hypothetical protein
VSGIVDVGGWVAPAMELIYEQGTAAFRGQWPRIESMLELAAPRRGRGDWPHPALELPAVPSRRARSDAWGTDDAPPPVPPVLAGVLHDNSAGRVAALDDAGVELQLISPGPSIDACLQLPSNLAAGTFGAYNRYLTAYCRAHPQRLGAVLQLHGSEPSWSAQEVAELRDHPSVRAVSLCLAVRISPEERQFDRLWEALEHAGLPLLHRPSLCARIWSPGRLLAYLRGSGVLERYPGLRVGFVAGDSDSSAVEVTRAIATDDAALGSRLFAAASSGQLDRGHDATAAMLWASDFPLRGSLRSELESARRALGPHAEEVLVASPRRFLGAVAGRPPRPGSARPAREAPPN